MTTNATFTNTNDATGSAAAPANKSFARHLPTVARYLLGAAFLVFGLNGFLNFIPQPPPETMPQGAVELGTAFMKSGYLFQLIKGTEVLVAVFLLANRFVPLALVVLAPVLVNIVAFHLWLAPSGLAAPIVLLALELYLAWTYRAVYAPLLTARALPAGR